MLSDCLLNNFRITAQIGSGAYGLVFHVVDILTSREYAVKTVFKSSSMDEFYNKNGLNNNSQVARTTLLQTQLYHFFKSFQKKLFLPSVDLDSILQLTENELNRLPHYREIAFQLRVQSHGNIVKIHQVLESSIATFIVMDYYDRDLFTSIVDDKHFVNDGILIKKVFLQLCSALDHCHRLGIYHCDIKPENVLLDRNDNAYLCDFGLSTKSKYLAPNVCVGSSYYMAPERILYCLNTTTNGIHVDECCSSLPTDTGDIWSLGIILINLTCIRNPWLKAHQKEDNTFHHFANDNNVLKKILPISDELFTVLTKILQLNPYTRIDMKTLMSEVSSLTSFTREGPLSQVPILSSEVYMTHIIRNENLFLSDLSHFSADQEQQQQQQQQVQEQEQEQKQGQIQNQEQAQQQQEEEDAEPESDIPSTYNSDGSMEKYEYTNNHNNSTFLTSSMDSTPYQSDIDDVSASKDCKFQQDTLRNRLLCLQMNFSTLTDGPNEKWLPDY
ncbi:CIC_collapsed_G0056840.mRNA.1.CDS.1 [Saccharomyces cerevisiae]|nr:Sks1p [Saccharomyces cerevisiae YJM1190]AJW21269.1 Sks1p [Saccharomyces cerevisiae YJM456]CAI4833056.1 ABH_G0055160.mRNA.1.CDS.1 [Saccharomyces cerevisiae]CAI6909922.1 ABH_G0055160.mRNA.1.CDS.1 [Saccharomyces cerevisiae]CAI7487626.1 CIC_collapsed_G0056840.mRNA.1.CDS.1 [Saccharomyces cerevisiae]